MSHEYLIQLMMAKGIGNVAIKKILNHVKFTPDISLEMLCECPDRLREFMNCSQSTIESVYSNADKAEQIAKSLDERNVTILLEGDNRYPKQLKQRLGKDCPAVLFVVGNTDLLSMNSVGFCGSRKVSLKGQGITAQCSKQLAQKDITVVSGYAAGTDITAHRSALLNGGNTIFVLAEGILSYIEKREVKEI